MTDSQIWIDAGYTDPPHFVRIGCDFSADGIWSEYGGSMWLERFPVSDDLRARIRAWQDAFDAIHYMDEDEYCASEPYIAEGRGIAIEVKRELPKCMVVAIDRRVRADLTLGERVPWPGEPAFAANRGQPYLDWRNALLHGEFPA